MKDIQATLARYPALLADHSSQLHGQMVGGSIRVATDGYDGYGYDDEVTPEIAETFRCRWEKNRDQRGTRTKNNAEVFTPTRVVNDMVQMMIDACTPEGFFDLEHTLLEPACGEGAFTVTRYEPDTGAPIPVAERVGMLDRRLLALTGDDWKTQAVRALRSQYALELQGDSLTICRANVLLTMVEHAAYVGETWTEDELGALVKIIATNCVQGDFLTMRPVFAASEEDAAIIWTFDGERDTLPDTVTAAERRAMLRGERAWTNAKRKRWEREHKHEPAQERLF